MTTHHWYPSRTRVEELSRELSRLETLAVHRAGQVVHLLPRISESLRKAHRLRGFPRTQIRQWIWIASQYRAYAESLPTVSALGGAAIQYLDKVVDSRGELTREDVQDLNWVVGRTVELLATELGPVAVRLNLSPEELVEIEKRLEELERVDIVDVDVLRNSVGTQIAEIKQLANDTHLPTLARKIDALFEAFEEGTDEERQISKAALLYLAEKDDVVSDVAGFLGLLDDIYVIEWAYSVIEHQTTWLPVLEEMLQKWPFVDEITFVSDDGTTKLDRYSGYVVCATLQSLFGDQCHNMLIVPEAGPYPLIGTLAAGLQLLRDEASSDNELTNVPEIGTDVIIGDEHTKLRARYGGRCDQEILPNSHWLIVKSRARISIDQELLPYVTRSPKSHKALDTGNQISTWIQTRPPTPLEHFIKGKRRFTTSGPGILLLSPKNKIDHYLPRVRPYGADIPSVLGMRYVSSTGRNSDVHGSATDLPSIFACSDPSTALELAKNKPEHISDWKIIVDGGQLAQQFWAGLSTAGLSVNEPICTVGELHHREQALALMNEGFHLWHLNYCDVEVPARHIHSPATRDQLKRFFYRQGKQWAPIRQSHEIRNDQLESITDSIRALAAQENGDRTGLESIRFMVSMFLKRVIEFPLTGDKQRIRTLTSQAHMIVSQTSVFLGYDENARNIYQLFKSIGDVNSLFSARERALREIISELSQECMEACVVLCRSNTVALTCRSLCKSDTHMSRIQWMTLSDLRHMAPVNTVILPGWLDRHSMREVANTGFCSRLHRIFYPFESRWHRSSMDAGAKWEYRLARKNQKKFVQVHDPLLPKPTTTLIWGTHPEPEAFVLQEGAEQELTATDQHEAPEIDHLEIRVIDEIKHHAASHKGGDSLSRGRLVLFEETGAFSYLHPHGRVIVLSDLERIDSEGGDADKNAKTSGRAAENMLMRKVKSLEPGSLLAFSVESDRDLIDGKADEYLEHAQHIRRLAAMWKAAIRRYLSNPAHSLKELSRRMGDKGQRRLPNTIYLWVTHSSTIAPRAYRRTIPIIADIMGDRELKKSMQEVLSAVDLLYRARQKAAAALVTEIFSNTIDLNAAELVFEIGDSRIRYELHRIRSIEGDVEVPHDLIGRIHHIEDSHTLFPLADMTSS